jgi:hypothetical protein
MTKSLLLLAAGCALLATSGTASAASPSAYRANVNAICKAGVAKINGAPTPKSPKGYAAYFDVEARLGLQLMQQIIAVRPPASLQPLVLKALKLQGKAVDGIIALSNRIKKGADPVKAVNAADPLLTKWTNQANAAWRAAGLNACAG